MDVLFGQRGDALYIFTIPHPPAGALGRGLPAPGPPIRAGSQHPARDDDAGERVDRAVAGDADSRRRWGRRGRGRAGGRARRAGQRPHTGGAARGAQGGPPALPAGRVEGQCRGPRPAPVARRHAQRERGRGRGPRHDCHDPLRALVQEPDAAPALRGHQARSGEAGPGRPSGAGGSRGLGEEGGGARDLSGQGVWE